MEFKELYNIKKFTNIDEIFKVYGSPKFKLGDRNIYYMGNGLSLMFCERQYKIIGTERMEYGETGKYLLRLSYFINCNEYELFYKLRNEKYGFEVDNLGKPIEITDSIKIGSTSDEVSKLLRPKVNTDSYNEGETRGMNEKKEFMFTNKWISWNNYTFLFFGKAKTTKLTGFEFLFNE